MLNVLIWLSFPTLLLATCLLAWLRGSHAERYASIFIFVANAGGDIALAVFYPKFPGAFLFALDFMLAVSLLIVALSYSSMWLGGAMLLQSAALCLHGLNFGGDGPSTAFHVVLNDAISYAMLVCVMAGTIVSWRNRLRGSRMAAASRTTPSTPDLVLQP